MKNILSESGPGPRLPREVQLQRMKNVIREELTENQRCMLNQYYFEKKTMTQIARERGIHVSTVSRTIQRAERRLRKFLRY